MAGVVVVGRSREGQGRGLGLEGWLEWATLCGRGGSRVRLRTEKTGRRRRGEARRRQSRGRALPFARSRLVSPDSPPTFSLSLELIATSRTLASDSSKALTRRPLSTNLLPTPTSLVRRKLPPSSPVPDHSTRLASPRRAPDSLARYAITAPAEEWHLALCRLSRTARAIPPKSSTSTPPQPRAWATGPGLLSLCRSPYRGHGTNKRAGLGSVSLTAALARRSS